MKLCLSRGLLLYLALAGIPAVLGAAQPLRLAITEFSLGAKTEPLRNEGAALADLLTSRLSREAQFQLVERVDLDRVLKEKGLSVAGLTKPDQAVKLGKLVKADWMCLPSFQNVDGTNYAFAKILDVNSGIIRDLTSVVLQRTNLVATAEGLANFLISSRSYVQTPNDRVFIAFGAFQNFGINRRYAGFGDRLRSAMARRYQGSRIAVVERSQVTPLLNEFRMAAGGLTQPTDKVASIQPAFVIVDGYYQSFQDHESKINVVLRIEAPGGRRLVFTIKELPGEAVENRIAACIQTALTKVATVSVSQRDEARVQLRRGAGLALFTSPYSTSWPTGTPPFDSARSKREPLLKDAISAFESVLLLEPEYLTAKLYLARCLADPHIDQLERARDLWREVIAATNNPALLKVVKGEFAKSYAEIDDRQFIELLSSLKSESTNLTEIASYDRDLEAAYRRLGTRIPVQQRVDLEVESWRTTLRSVELDASQNARTYHHLHTAFRGPHWSHLYSAVEGDRAAKTAQVENVVSNFMAEFPRLRPYLISGLVQWQAGTIRSGTEERVWDVVSLSWRNLYEEVIADCEKGTNRVFQEDTFYVDGLWPSLQMFLRHKELTFAERLANLLQKNGRQYLNRANMDELNLYTGYLLFQRQQWAEAAAAFDRIGDREVRTSFQGPWGKGNVASGRVAAQVSRQRLAGQDTAPGAPESLPAPKPVKTFRGQEILFTFEGSRMWVTDDLTLVEYHPETGETRRMPLPVTPSEINASSFTSMVLAGGKLWIGTRRDGLLAVDTSTRTLTNYTVNSGLLKNQVTALHLHQDRLWIGFAGAVGYYDMRDRRFVGLMAELPAELAGGPSSIVDRKPIRDAPAPRGYFQAFAALPSGQLWAAMSYGSLLLFDAKSNRWNAASALADCKCQSANLATTGEFLVVPCYEPSSWSSQDTQFGGLLIHDLAKKNCRRVTIANGLPNNALRNVALDGSKAWVGGRGFIALVDLPAGKVEKVCQLKSTARVRSLEVNGNELWFSAGPGLYRLSKDGDPIDPAPVIASSRPPVPQGEPKDEAAQLVDDLKAARAITRERAEFRRVYGNTETEEYKALGQKFAAQVHKVADVFPSIDLATNNFFTFVVNQRGGQFDGIRFRNNSAEIKYFGWIFAFEEPRSLAFWGVLPREPQPVVCLFRGGEPTLIYTNAPWSGRRNIFFERSQSIRNKSILPGKEYTIWFSFADTRPNTIHFFCSLFPSNQEISSAELDTAFGLKGNLRYPSPSPYSTRSSTASEPE